MLFRSSRVEERLGSRRFLLLYFIAGVTGALLSAVMAFNASIIGASGGVFGVMLAFARFWPRERIYIWGVIPVEAWLLVEDPGSAVHAAPDGRLAVAYGELWPDPAESEVELARLIVDPRRRNRHVGRALAGRLAARAAADHPELGLVVLRVQPGNEAAMRAYAAAGFQRVGPEEEAAWNRGQRVAWAWMRFG